MFCYSRDLKGEGTGHAMGHTRGASVGQKAEGEGNLWEEGAWEVGHEGLGSTSRHSFSRLWALGAAPVSGVRPWGDGGRWAMAWSMTAQWRKWRGGGGGGWTVAWGGGARGGGGGGVRAL